MIPAAAATWTIVALAIAGVIVRPFGWPEAVWAVAGAVLLLVLQFLSPHEVLAGIAKGTDVYLFLTGMMLLSEVSRAEGLFDWLAVLATRRAQGSPHRLFLLTYLVGVAVTVFLSNDATAVVLTPAVAAAMRAAKIDNPLPYLSSCAIVANAASFALPISNPANLVIYGTEMPPLGVWLARYGAASLAAIVVTFAMLRWAERSTLRGVIDSDIPQPPLGRSGRVAACGIALTALVLLACSALDLQLGLPTAVAGMATALTVLVLERRSPWRVIRHVSWAVLPLVAGLFVLVEALAKTGVVRLLTELLQVEAGESALATAWGSGLAVAVASNLLNNLPTGLIAASAVHDGAIAEPIVRALLIGVDLGPNLSITGSLATILWLAALRRDGIAVSAWDFCRLGLLVMPPSLLAALALAQCF
jgi:arsenical pump membrane protein